MERNYIRIVIIKRNEKEVTNKLLCNMIFLSDYIDVM